MANKRIKDLDAQSTRLADLLIPCDRASVFTEAKVIRADKLAPKINELTTGSITNRATSYLKWNDGTGNEYKINANGIYTKTGDLPNAPVTLADADKFRIQRSGSSDENYYTASGIAGYICTNSSVQAKINELINIQVIDYYTTIAAIPLKVTIEGAIFGYLYLTRFKNIVTGVCKITSSATLGINEMLYELPTIFRPMTDYAIGFQYTAYITSAWQTNTVVFQEDGSIFFNLTYTTGSYIVIPISYVIG
jgi:hypothetical protein